MWTTVFVLKPEGDERDAKGNFVNLDERQRPIKFCLDVSQLILIVCNFV